MSTRTIDAALVTAAKARAGYQRVFLARLGFDDGDLLATNAPFNIAFDWDGDAVDETFLGVGSLGQISRLEESVDVQPYSISAQLSGIDPALVSIAMQEHYQGRDMRVWMAFLADADYAIAGAPLLLFRGRIDTMNIKLGQTATITVTAHSRLADWDRPRVRRFTNEDQQAVWPGDKGLEFAAETSEKELIWGTG